MAILLLFSTLSLILGNPYFDFDHLEGSEEKDCENICDSGKAQNDICQKMSISTSDVLIWIYVTWGLFGLSLIHAVGIFLLRKVTSESDPLIILELSVSKTLLITGKSL